MQDISGLRILTWSGPAAIRRHSQRLPRYGSLSWIVRRGRREYYMRWQRWHGVSVDAWRWVSQSRDPLAWTDFGGSIPMGLIKRAQPSETLKLPDLPAVTKLLQKFPTLIAFISSRSWPDGSPRVPGRFWFDPTPSGYTITLIDVDQCLRIKVHAGTIDDVFAAAELVIGTESSQWEIDPWSAEQAAKKMKKKK